MKLEYSKPVFIMESFSLAQSIAAGCSAENPANPSSSIGDPNWGSKTECGWSVGGSVIWTEINRDCVIKASPYEEVLGFCYNNPGGNNVIFMS